MLDLLKIFMHHFILLGALGDLRELCHRFYWPFSYVISEDVNLFHLPLEYQLTESSYFNFQVFIWKSLPSSLQGVAYQWKENLGKLNIWSCKNMIQLVNYHSLTEGVFAFWNILMHGICFLVWELVNSRWNT